MVRELCSNFFTGKLFFFFFFFFFFDLIPCRNPFLIPSPPCRYFAGALRSIGLTEKQTLQMWMMEALALVLSSFFLGSCIGILVACR